MQERVRYFSNSDLSLSYYLQMAESVVDSYSNGATPQDINDYLEMYQIVLFVENGIISNSWDEEKIKEIKSYTGSIAKYLHEIKAEELCSVYSMILPIYSDVFWKVIDRYNIKGLINNENLTTLFVSEPQALREILENERLVICNNRTLADLLMNHDHAAEYLLRCYVEGDKAESNKQKLYIPTALSTEEKDDIINRYIDSPDVNLNYVRLINVARNTQEFKLSDKTRLKAQRKERELNSQLFTKSNTLTTHYVVQMSDDESAPIKDAKLEDGRHPTFTYNSKVLAQQDPEGLLDYCARVFEFTNSMGLITSISKESNMSIVDRLFGLSANNTYNTNISFQFYEYISRLQMEAMQNVLLKNGKSIESMLKTFYEDVLPKEYGCEGLIVEFANESDTWGRKCTFTLPIMENLARQYTVFCENGAIDPELVAIMAPMKITDMPSCYRKKYYVLKNPDLELKNIMFLFFSDQSMLTYVEPHKDKHYQNFYELLRKEDVIPYANYEDFQKPQIDFLIQKAYLSISDEGLLQVEKPEEIQILQMLNEYHACPYWYYSSEAQNILYDMQKRGWVTEESHLLTPDERDYFSYYLNNEKYTNGPALRNRYMHGSTMGNSEGAHKEAYFRIMFLLTLMSIKILEDLRLRSAIGAME